MYNDLCLVGRIKKFFFCGVKKTVKIISAMMKLSEQRGNMLHGVATGAKVINIVVVTMWTK